MTKNVYVEPKFRRAKVIFVDYDFLPYSVRDSLNIARDTRYEWYCSEMSPINDNDWASKLTLENLTKYWQDQCQLNNYNGTLEQFIIDYNLVFDKWLIDTKVDLTDIKEIFIGR